MTTQNMNWCNAEITKYTQKRQTDNMISQRREKTRNEQPQDIESRQCVSSAGDVICASGRRRARAQLSGTLFPQFVVSDGGQNSYFHLLPAAVVEVFGVLLITSVQDELNLISLT